MERIDSLSKILCGGDVCDAASTIFILDSVVIFTLCQLSQICCIGAVFRMRKKNIENLKLKSFQDLLLVDHLDKEILQRVYPILEKNFVGYDAHIIKVSHIITLVFVRNFCKNFNIKTAFENIEKDIKGEEGWENFKTVAENFLLKKKYEEAANSYFSALSQNAYFLDLYLHLANCYANMKKYKAVQLYSYLAISINGRCFEAYYHFINSLIKQEKYDEVDPIIDYASSIFDESQFSLKFNGMCDEAENLLKMILFKKESKLSNMRNYVMSSEYSEKTSREKLHCVLRENHPALVKLTDSDSSESEEESENSKKAPELVDDDSNESEIEEKPDINTQEKAKSKPQCIIKRKGTLSEGLENVPSEEEMAVSKINSFLKEASEALLADCGYKAVQLFRGPLRSFIESSKLQTFEECDIVCIKYSYGIAYCKSGGYDDLQKCIMILKDIIQNHDFITFPAAHYSLGLAHRKLNRFKESLNYLEIVRNFLNKGIHFKVYPWPGMTTVIQETKPDILKSLVEDLIKECENPPNPDAFCRFENCEYQPTIYYTDPDFKGYVSLCCSEQCTLQYHFLCWKEIKAEKDLTDKEFLEKACFTPDCEGVIVKIQNIDKKGDLGKEFISDFKKNIRQKWAKWEKKTTEREREIKEKKRRRKNSKSEETSNGNERKNSLNVDDEPLPQLSGACGYEEINKSEMPEKALYNVQEATKSNVQSQSHIVRSMSANSQELSNAPHIVEDKKEMQGAKQVQENDSGYHLNECIKSNIYMLMDNFLQDHGPLKVDDPLLVDELTSLPEEARTIIAESGGIGDFLKNDLRFAYVGNLYVCIISDLAAAYKMCSSSCLPSDFKSLQSLESIDDSKYYNKSRVEVGLNPDAMEYTPSGINKNNHYKFPSNNSDLTLDSSTFISSAFKPSSECASDTCVMPNMSITLQRMDEFVDKVKSCKGVLSKELQTDRKSVSCTFTHAEKSDLCDNSDSGNTSESMLQTNQVSYKSDNIDSKVTADTFCENGVCDKDNANIALARSEYENSKTQLLSLLNCYYSEESNPYRQEIDLYINPFVIKKLPESTSSGTNTDISGLCSKLDIVSLAEENALMRNKLKSLAQKQQLLDLEGAKLEIRLKEHEVEKKDFTRKEQELVKEKNCIMESLKKACETIEKQKKELIRMEKNVDILKISFEEAKREKKSGLDAQEKQFKNDILNLRNERDELKSRAKCAELQVLYLKKSEYLKKIDEKSVEAARRRKELTDGLSMVSGNLNPVVQNNVKALSEQLLTYIKCLSIIKLNFMNDIDKEIEEVKNGTPLKGRKELEMGELPEIPSWKNSFSANGSALDKPIISPIQLPLNFSLNAGISAQVPPASLNFPLTSTSSEISGIPVAKIPATTGVALVAPATVTATSTIASSVMLSGLNKSNKTELCNGSVEFGLNSQIEESFKSAMASINSFASSSYPVPLLDDEFQKKCVVFKHPDPVPIINKPDISNVPPPGIQNTTSPVKTTKTLDRELAATYSAEIDPLPIAKLEAARSAWDLEQKKKTSISRNSYEKLLSKLKEQFPQYNQDQLISFVREFRSQRQGKLSGLTMDTIINQITTLIKSKSMPEKKVPEPKVMPKSTKVLVNKKLVPDPKPPSAISEPQSVKKKAAWGSVDLDSKMRFSGIPDDDCTICYDPMTSSSAYKVSCGHFFHEHCIREWLKNKSDCPVCRVLLLLPEEYPSLS